MMTTAEISDLRFGLPESARICLMNGQILRDWVTHGRVTPVAFGRGQGRSHQFSVGQLLGITTAEAYLRAGWCSPRRTIEVIEMFAGMDEASLREWLNIGTDDHTEEALAVFATHPFFAEHGLRPAGLDRLNEEVAERHDRVERAVRRRLRVAMIR
jgi:hypothetical protein